MVQKTCVGRSQLNDRPIWSEIAAQDRSAPDSETGLANEQ